MNGIRLASLFQFRYNWEFPSLVFPGHISNYFVSRAAIGNADKVMGTRFGIPVEQGNHLTKNVLGGKTIIHAGLIIKVGAEGLNHGDALRHPWTFLSFQEIEH